MTNRFPTYRKLLPALATSTLAVVATTTPAASWQGALPAWREAVVMRVPPEVRASPPRVTAYRAPDGMFYLHAAVNGVPVRFLVDTGSSDIVLTATDAARAGLRREGPAGKYRTMGGIAALHRVTVSHVRVEHFDLADVRALVAGAAGGMPVSLMGQSFLSQLGRLHIDGDRLEI